MISYDSTGIGIIEIPIDQVAPGMRIAGGWRPWAVVERVERKRVEENVEVRLHFANPHQEHHTGWLDRSEIINVVVADPEDASEAGQGA